MRELAQLFSCALRLVEGLGQEQRAIVPLLECLAGQLESDDRVDKTLLRAVVQIANRVSRS